MTFTANLGVAWQLIVLPPAVTPLWSVSLEEQFYILWPCFLKLARSPKVRFFVAGAMFAGTIAFRAHLMQASPNDYVPYYYNTFSRLDPLILGTVLAFTIRYVPGFMEKAQKLGLLWLAIALGLFQWHWSHYIVLSSNHSPFAMTIVDFSCAFFLLSILTFKPLASFSRINT